ARSRLTSSGEEEDEPEHGVDGEQRIQAPANPRPLAELGRALEGMGRRGAMGGPGGPTAGAAGNLTGPQLLVAD
ncbi:MAG: hypothetical protein H0V03_01055, partial [Thermoleophilaceae bacterium]|nr:hypothetical protein [Thermoleophilaceae bacterium]